MPPLGNKWVFVVVIGVLVWFPALLVIASFLGFFFFWEPSPINTSKCHAQSGPKTLTTSIALTQNLNNNNERKKWCLTDVTSLLSVGFHAQSVANSVLAHFLSGSLGLQCFLSSETIHISLVYISFIWVSWGHFCCLQPNDSVSKMTARTGIYLPKSRSRSIVPGSAHCGAPKSCHLAAESYFSRNLLSTSGWLS